MVPHKGGVGQSEIDIPPKMDGSDWKRSKKWTHGGRTLTYQKVSARNE